VEIDGHDIFEDPGQAKRRIGYLPEQPPLYMNETPVEYLRFVGEAKGIKGGELESQIQEVIRQTGIGEVKNRRISALSKGYKQRVGIAQALLGNPQVIILDEPTVGLDPLQIIEIRDLIRELGRTHTVIFSSHILSEVQTICDQILFIGKGKLLAFDTPENLEKQLLAPSEILLTTEATTDEIVRILNGVGHIVEAQIADRRGNLISMRLKTDCDNIYDVSRAIFFAFAKEGKALLEMSLKKANLEDIFLELTENAPQEEWPEDAGPAETAEEVDEP